MNKLGCFIDLLHNSMTFYVKVLLGILERFGLPKWQSQTPAKLSCEQLSLSIEGKLSLNIQAFLASLSTAISSL